MFCGFGEGGGDGSAYGGESESQIINQSINPCCTQGSNPFCDETANFGTFFPRNPWGAAAQKIDQNQNFQGVKRMEKQGGGGRRFQNGKDPRICEIIYRNRKI